MPLHLELDDFDKMISEIGTPPIIANDWDLSCKEKRKELQRLISLTWESNSMETTCTCHCVGVFHPRANSGLICDKCGSVISYSLEDPIVPHVWVRSPEGMPKLINPMGLMLLRKRITKRGIDPIMWFCVPSYRLRDTKQAEKEKLIASGFPRGYASFVENFKPIMKFLIDNNYYGIRADKKEDMWIYVQEQEANMFSTYIPVPNRVVMLKKKTFSGNYADEEQKYFLSALYTICLLSSDNFNLTPRVREARLAKACFSLADYYHRLITEQLGGKTGQFRKHLYGERLNHTARAVISSITGVHNFEEITLPWALAVGLYQTDIQSKLLDRNFTPRQIVKLCSEAEVKYSPYIAGILDELMAETPYGGFYGILLRPPTMYQLSGQRLVCRKIKKDVKDNTIGMSVGTTTATNADFDGDMLIWTMLREKHHIDGCASIAPWTAVLDRNKPNAVSKMCSLYAPTVTNTMLYLTDDLL